MQFPKGMGRFEHSQSEFQNSSQHGGSGATTAPRSNKVSHKYTNIILDHTCYNHDRETYRKRPNSIGQMQHRQPRDNGVVVVFGQIMGHFVEIPRQMRDIVAAAAVGVGGGVRCGGCGGGGGGGGGGCGCSLRVHQVAVGQVTLARQGLRCPVKIF